jgi:hypothetical protein
MEPTAPKEKKEEALKKSSVNYEKEASTSRGGKKYPGISEAIPAVQEPPKSESVELKETASRDRREKSTTTEAEAPGKVHQMQTVSDESIIADADKEGSEFFRTQTNVSNQRSLSEKIDLWENFISTNTDSVSVSHAKWELAQLYYQQAMETNSPEHIEQALNYYMTNRTSFQTQQPFQSQQETLQNLQQTP